MRRIELLIAVIVIVLAVATCQAGVVVYHEPCTAAYPLIEAPTEAVACCCCVKVPRAPRCHRMSWGRIERTIHWERPLLLPRLCR